MSRSSRRLSALLILPLVLLGAMCTASQADAFGELTFRECVANTTVGGCSALTSATLDTARAVTVSPDGKSVYAVSVGSDAITTFVRNADGSLTFAGCASSTALAGCTDLPSSPMLNPTDVEVSPDGASVYVIAAQSNGLLRFARAADGSLTFASCLNDSGSDGCTDLPNTPLTAPVQLAISPDGSSIYVSGSLTATVSHFTVSTGGVPSFANCVADDGSDGCTDLPANLLTNAFGVAVSPDGGSLYVAAPQAQVVSHFTLGATGNMTFSDCANNGGGLCATLFPSSVMVAPIAIGVGPSGMIYAVGNDSNTLAELALDGSGKMQFAGCLANAAIPGCVDLPNNPISHPTALAISPLGDSVYMSSQGFDPPFLDTIIHFKANASGRLTFDSCQGDTGAEGCLDLPGSPIDGVINLGMAPEGDSLYAASFNSDSVSHFSRAVPAPVLDTTAPETTIDSGPKKKAKKRKATFSFSSSEPGVTFSCSVDGGAASSCTSPTKVKVKPKPKRHTFTVAAVDAAGNTDATPATFAWKVKKKKH